MTDKEFWNERAIFVRAARNTGFGDMLDRDAADEALENAGFVRRVEVDPEEPPAVAAAE
jgi:hypothetical protein